MNNMQGMMGGGNLTNKEQKDLEEMMQDMMFQEMQDMYIGLVNRCFNKCVNAFRTRTIQSSEKDCLSNCVAKSIAHNKRVQMRFAEQNQQMAQQQGLGGMK
mmetsp:Transcript_18302/g.44923  ORF Transcript_18302/g.44923 Transcript_18302/m.44923 type:complete len:101 (+) Transcript_18302:165-467(+)|eukprot:CAMPEP_0114506374 /NCGR_PEP_ID=MMETSP0109-20121206/11393_1 /TAXON_ID=29199 /ORGANISM="Chlorarachnion reptans, Strain CCCM449" /LENGTH=100 /DNA_ID=CAMNT_0001684957 /DNA_START=160 /DNA_END=462 /DNA_ORIENTATION=+